MGEVIALENQIRAALAHIRAAIDLDGPPRPLGNLIDDAQAILQGKPTSITGTRLERLRVIAAGLA